MGRQNILHQMIASISCLHSTINIFLNRISICSGCSQIFQVLQTYKGNINNFHIVTLSCILESRHDHVLVLLAFTSNPISSKIYKLLWFSFAVCIFFPIYINIISIKEKLIFSIYFHTF